MSNIDASAGLNLSPLGHTWLIDLDGTILIHNGFKTEHGDSVIPAAEQFLKGLPKEDTIIFLTSRPLELRESTERLLRDHSIPFDLIVYGLPYGERIVINDSKPSGLPMAYACPIVRDSFNVTYTIDQTL